MSGAGPLILHVRVRGRVQGVGYRAWTERVALEHGLEGWVRNRADGSVEAVFAGPASRVRAMVERCRRGPGGARVDAVDVEEGDAGLIALQRPGEQFSMLPTA